MTRAAEVAAAPRRRRAAVAIIVLSQWLGTSLWFSPSGVADGLMARLEIGPWGFAWLIAATQLGFICGTLGVAATGLADRLAASRIFAFSSVAGAALNAALALAGVDYGAAWALRFGVGACLAGIYPLGMKMIVQWAGGRPAAALGWLVGMLTLGTAMPHALARQRRRLAVARPCCLASSLLALVGAVLVYLLGDGPGAVAAPRAGDGPSAAAAACARNVREPARGEIGQVFRVPGFRASAFGATLARCGSLMCSGACCRGCVCPSARRSRLRAGADFAPSVALLSFAVIAVGGLGCCSRRPMEPPHRQRARGGARAGRLGADVSRLSAAARRRSSRCASRRFSWGFCVVADSPQFSALPAQFRAAANCSAAPLVAQNGIGFLITVALASSP